MEKQKQEDDRRRNEAEMLRQQQMALMEAQRDEQQKRMQSGRFYLLCLPHQPVHLSVIPSQNCVCSRTRKLFEIFR